MKNTSSSVRQSMACGYVPPIDGARAWTGAFEPRTEAEEPKTCAGYTTRLPEVIEAARAACWKGDLRAFCGGIDPPQGLIWGAELFDDQRNAVERWSFKNPEDGKP